MTGDRLTAEQASALRRHYARLADRYSERCIDALLDGRYRTAVRYEHAYRNAAGHCRALGGRMRGEAATAGKAGASR